MPEQKIACMVDSSTGANSPPAGTYLCCDYGLKRIGLAVGHTATGLTEPLKVVINQHGQPDWQILDSLVDEWLPVGLVVGRPLQLDGKTQLMTRESDGFARRLRKRYQLPVFAADERESSMQAAAVVRQQRQIGARGKTRSGDIDKIAAALILKNWLELTFKP